MLYDIEHDHKF